MVLTALITAAVRSPFLFSYAMLQETKIRECILFNALYMKEIDFIQVNGSFIRGKSV